MILRDNLNGRGHDRFVELAAIATAGGLTSDESTALRDHLRVCEECREVSYQYRVLAREGFPILASGYKHLDRETDWDDTAARRRLFARIEGTERTRVASANIASPVQARQLLHIPACMNSRFLLALSACLLIGVAVGAWRHGRLAPARELAAPASGGRLSGNSARGSMVVPPAAQSDEVARLEDEIAEKDREAAETRRQLEELRLRLTEQLAMANKLAAARSDSDDQLRALTAQREALSEQLRQASQALENMRQDLTRLSEERDGANSLVTSVTARINELTSRNQDQERLLKDSEQYLSADQDIRELMGARNLYIADVFDVDSHNRTRQPFGRVFYTREKSLVFYAFDLDRQPRVRSASAFQVWGREETAQGKQSSSLNLGILYLDSESSRRWILRFDDAQALARIDSVFVTVEPAGGSPRPTGKPFLFAMLRKEANHP